ncbi:hypothetical protein [Candidatus Korobacter versatilis]|nr:hypothetical protein [Candidatus Koribacter versatilis]
MSNEGVLPLGILPVRTTDPPKKTSLPDITIFEFPIIGAVAIADALPWDPIEIDRNNLRMRIFKPKPALHSVTVGGELTTQAIDIRSTLFRVECELLGQADTPNVLDVFPVVNEFVHLIRIVARQYWLGLAMANEGSVTQGVRTRIEAGNAVFTGQGSYSVPFIVTGLTSFGWHFLGDLFVNQCFPGTAELLLCDALVEVRRGALAQAALLLGVASEVELSTFLNDIATWKGLSKNKRQAIADTKFREKLVTRTVELGIPDPQGITIPPFAPGWAQTLLELYRIRNQAAHGGTATVTVGSVVRPIDLTDTARFIFAVEALLAWTAQQRVSRSISTSVTATMLPSGYPLKAVIDPRNTP